MLCDNCGKETNGDHEYCGILGVWCRTCIIKSDAVKTGRVQQPQQPEQCNDPGCFYDAPHDAH